MSGYYNNIPSYGNSNDLPPLLIILSIFGLYLLLRAIYWHYKVTPIIVANHYDDPVISSQQLNDSSQSMAKGKIAGHSYNLLTNSAGNVMLLIALPRNTNLHIVAVGENSLLLKLLAEKVSNNLLEPAELEGDFPKYFQVFCTPGRQVELRQVLEPANMQRLVDFCKGYNLEIFKETLYISQVGKTADELDSTTLVADAETFIRRNTDMLERI